MTYDGVVHFVKTWGMVYMLAIFAGAMIYALWPSSKKKFDDAASIPLKED